MTKHLPIASALVALVVILGSGYYAYGGGESAKYNIENFYGTIAESGPVQGPTPVPALEFGGTVENARIKFTGGVDLTSATSGEYMAIASGTRQYTTSEICTKSIFNLDGDGYASVQAQVLPSGSSIIRQCLLNKGDSRTILFWNSSVDELSTINFTTNSGLDALIASSSAGSVIEIPADRGVFVQFINFDGASVSLKFDEVRDSD